MTQEYEPIAITADMPEPEAFGHYLVSYDGEVLIIKKEGTPSDVRWWDPGLNVQAWDQIRHNWVGFHIQSLADHDTQIRAEALKLTDEERDAAILALGDNQTSSTPCNFNAVTEIFDAVEEVRKREEL